MISCAVKEVVGAAAAVPRWRGAAGQGLSVGVTRCRPPGRAGYRWDIWGLTWAELVQMGGKNGGRCGKVVGREGLDWQVLGGQGKGWQAV